MGELLFLDEFSLWTIEERVTRLTEQSPLYNSKIHLIQTHTAPPMARACREETSAVRGVVQYDDSCKC